jgi:hypothetical protein
MELSSSQHTVEPNSENHIFCKVTALGFIGLTTVADLIILLFFIFEIFAVKLACLLHVEKND